MSLQWTLVAGFLTAEIAIVLFLSFPIVSPSKLHKVFKSKVLKAILAQLQKYFGFILFALVLFLCDSIRDLRKYSEISAEERDKYANLDSEMLVQLRLFRAQRNFYVCGFALVLSVVIRRFITLIEEQAALLKALKNQPLPAAQEKTDQLIVEKTDSDAHRKQLNDKQLRISELERELRREKKDKESVTSLCDTMTRKYKEELLCNTRAKERLAPASDKKSI